VQQIDEKIASGEGLVRAIGRWSIAALTINCIIGSGVFGLPSILAALLGRASSLAVLLAALAIAVVMACFAEVASRFANTGGPYLYAHAAFGRFMGIQVAWLMWVVRVTSCAANANLFVTYLAQFWPGATTTHVNLTILTILIGVLALINIRGVRAGTRVSSSFTIAKLSSLIIVAVAGGFWLLLKHPAPGNNSIALGTTQWTHAIVLLIFAYGGFEAALISAGEATDPRRDLPFGLFAALLTCAAIYGILQWVVVGILPDPAHSDRPLADVARIVMGNAGASLTAIGALLSIYGYLSANMLTMPRITFALAERGDFPSVFACLHPRFKTPWFSILVFAATVWILAFFGSFAGNATLSAGSRLFYYGVVCAALPVLRRRDADTPPRFELPAGTVFAVLGVLICLGLFAQIEYTKALILLAAVAVAFLNWLAVRHRSPFSGQFENPKIRGDC